MEGKKERRKEIKGGNETEGEGKKKEKMKKGKR